MEKEALIDIILNDIKEVETLVRTFKGKSSIKPAFLNLTKTKLKNIFEELDLLEEFGSSTATSNETNIETESSLTSPIQSSNQTEEDGEKIAESSKQIIHEEAAPMSHQTDSPTNNEPKVIAEPVHTEPAPAIEQVVEKKTVPQATKPEKTENKPKATKPVQPVASNEPAILGEKIGKDKKSVYERVAPQQEQSESIKQIGKPVDDIRKAFGLNDRFYYQRELFNGNPDLFNQTLDQINELDSFESASHFLQSNFHWDSNNEVAETFLKSVKRRFI